jgi:hypothetical protein
MPRVCTVCTHTRSREINAAIIAHLSSFRSIANKYHLGTESLNRHKKNCMPGLIEAMRVATGIVESRSILEQMQALHQRCLALLSRAEASGNIETALRAIREARGNLELLGRLDGTLLPGSQAPGEVTINVHYVDRMPAAIPAPAIDVTPVDD